METVDIMLMSSGEKALPTKYWWIRSCPGYTAMRFCERIHGAECKNSSFGYLHVEYAITDDIQLNFT